MGKALVTLHHRIMGLSAAAVVNYRHFFAVLAAAPYGRVNVALVRNIASVYHSLIYSVQAVLFNLRSQINMGKIVLCHKQKPACILVNAVHNARAQHSVYAGKTALAVPQKRVYKGSVMIAGRRVHYHSLWFVNNQKVVILVVNIQRNVLRLHIKLHCVRHGHGNILARFEHAAFRRFFAVHGNSAGGNNFL